MKTGMPPILFWGSAGQIGCSKPGHAPYLGSDTWVREGWRRMTDAELAAWRRAAGAPPGCETCAVKKER